MAALGAVRLLGSAQDDAGLGQLRGDALRAVLVIVAAFAFGLLLFAGMSIARLGEQPAYVALSLAAVAGISLYLLRFGPRPAAAGLVAGLLCSIALAALLYPAVPAAAALMVPVLLATVLLGSGPGTATAVGGTLLVWVLASRQDAPDPTAAIELALVWVVLACTLVLWRGFYVVLDWSWASYAEAQRRT